MMPAHSSLVVDASVVVKWVLENEELAAEARALLAQGLRQEWRLVAPPLLVAETTNAVYQRFRRGEMTGDETDRLVAHVWSQPVVLCRLPTSPSAPTALCDATVLPTSMTVTMSSLRRS